MVEPSVSQTLPTSIRQEKLAFGGPLQRGPTQKPMGANGADMVETPIIMNDTEYLHKTHGKAAKPGDHFSLSQDIGVLLKLCLNGVTYLKQKYKANLCSAPEASTHCT